METVTKHYLIAALWTSTDDSEQPLDDNYSIEDIAPSCIDEAERDCLSFRLEHADLIIESGMSDEQLGHDLWLTRNGHGVGFWDRGYPKEIGDALTNFAQAMGQSDLYVGDDGKLHLYP